MTFFTFPGKIRTLEVNGINRQTFLAELGKLLTFMYEEDRQAALALYNRLFDECSDEQAIIQMLASPTRQAVIIARAYNRNERKLQVDSRNDHNKEQTETIPEFILAIEHLFYDAEDKGIISTELPSEEEYVPLVDENQITFFDMSEPEMAAAPAVSGDFHDSPAVEPHVGQAPVKADEVASAEKLEENRDKESAESETSSEKPLPDPGQDDIDVFIRNFSIDDEKAEKDPASNEENAEPDPVIEVENTPEVTAKRVRKVMVGWLILYIIIAVPVGVSVIALLTVPTILSLVISAGLSVVGILAFSTVFSAGLVVLADILVVVGVGIITLAFGILFLWLFVWFIGGAMVGAVRGIINLGKSWCCKEVHSDE